MFYRGSKLFRSTAPVSINWRPNPGGKAHEQCSDLSSFKRRFRIFSKLKPAISACLIDRKHPWLFASISRSNRKQRRLRDIRGARWGKCRILIARFCRTHWRGFIVFAPCTTLIRSFWCCRAGKWIWSIFLKKNPIYPKMSFSAEYAYSVESRVTFRGHCSMRTTRLSVATTHL